MFWPGELHNTTEQWFAYIDCNKTSTSTDMITAQGNGSSAIILYYKDEPCTYPTQYELSEIKIPVFSEKYTKCYTAISSAMDELAKPPQATIMRGGSKNNSHYDGSGPYSKPSSNSINDNGNVEAKDNSAQPYQTAMVVLYTISGVVLGLFFLVVITNVVINRVRSQQDSGIISNNDSSQGQKHVGIAKAVLESFPVYLFSLRSNSDVNKDLENGGKDIKDTESKEMQIDNDKNDIPLKELSLSQTQETNQNDETSQLSEVEGDESSKNVNKTSQNVSNSDNQSTSILVLPSNKVTEEQLTCPICLGDFESGEELRILPCHHQYHTEEASTSHVERASSLASTSQNETDTTSSHSSHSSHVFPHFRWIKYLTSARRARSERRRNRRSRNGQS
ncbi:6841_t:CDS:2, partial [Gigaspora margarita]